MRVNLLDETLHILEKNNLSWNNVTSITIGEHGYERQVDLQSTLTIFKYCTYNNTISFNKPKVNPTVKIWGCGEQINSRDHSNKFVIQRLINKSTSTEYWNFVWIGYNPNNKSTYNGDDLIMD